jgi:RES domain-containing protein
VVLWRISNHASLTGEGGMRASGRWHSRGHRIVYCSENPAAALLEILAHLEVDLRDLPARYQLLKLNAPNGLPVQRAPALTPTWLKRLEVTRAIGDRWLRGGRSPLLRVPSALVPDTFNVLLNPAHPQARQVTIVSVSKHVVDPRLLD